jgi:hypothetical protein
LQILWQGIQFQPAVDETKAVAILKDALCNTPGLKTLDSSDGAGQRVVGVDASSEWWRATLQHN